MDYDKLIEQLRTESLYADKASLEIMDLCMEAADALSTLQAENEKLRGELEQMKRLYESEKEDFLDYACSGIPNFAPYCFNRHPDCVDERGWCKSAECHGFSRNRSQKED